jgi:hydrogenase maturation protease
MTDRAPARDEARDGARAGPSRRAAPPIAAEVLVCGSSDRGDDGAPIAAADALRADLPDDVRVRVVGQLDIDDLLDVPAGARVVIVDAAIGIRPGEIVELPLTGLLGGEERIRPRSSHALAIPEVIGLAGLIRGRPLEGRVVVIGGVAFGLGASLSPNVARAIPGLVRAIRDAVERDRA